MRSPGTPPARATRLLRRSRWFVLAVVLSRVLAVLVAIQSSGATHLAIDVIEFCSGEPHADKDCSEEEESKHGCPPGCPSCHAQCGFLASLPPSTCSEPELPPADTNVMLPRPREDGKPPSADRVSVFRPPRTSAFA